MTDPFEIQRAKYKFTVPAEALFFSYNNRKATRVSAGTIGLEFIDGQYIGSGKP